MPARADESCNLFGLLSDGGVHSQLAHLFALLKMAKQNGVDRAFVHAFHGRARHAATSGAGYLEQLQQKMRDYNSGKIARSADATTRWMRPALERIAKAYNAMVFGQGEGGTYVIRCRE